MQNIFDIIKNIIKKKFGKTVKMDTVLSEIGIDSLDVLDLVVDAEEKFNIKIEDEELIRLKTIEDIVDLINKKL